MAGRGDRVVRVLAVAAALSGCTVMQGTYERKAEESDILAKQVAALQKRCDDLSAENAALQGLACVNTALVHRVAAQGKSTTATLDHDATIQESHKREALPHYQGGRGYQPTAVYWCYRSRENVKIRLFCR